uniref:Omega 6 fatty acid desaturase n=1 Tax=Rhizophora mucronata TaxID=61149 RepID=A0A2P2INL5_RHIMU
MTTHIIVLIFIIVTIVQVNGFMNHEYHVEYDEAHQQFWETYAASQRLCAQRHQDPSNAEPTPSAPKMRKYRLRKARVSEIPNPAVYDSHEIASDGRTHRLPHPIKWPLHMLWVQESFPNLTKFYSSSVNQYRRERA